MRKMTTRVTAVARERVESIALKRESDYRPATDIENEVESELLRECMQALGSRGL